MIVGVDAGATAAIAVLDLDGNLLHAQSRKHWRTDALLSSVAEWNPVIVACDTNPAHHVAQALRRSFSAKLFVPKHSLSQVEKMRMTRDYRVADVHQRDALAAAVYAYRHHANKLRQAAKKTRAHLGRAPRAEERRSVGSLVLRGTRMSEAVKRLKDERATD